MKILHVLSSPRAEGTPNLVLDWLATGLHEQEVFVLNSQPADLTDRLRSKAKWYGETDLFSEGLVKFPKMTWLIHQVCRDRRPDLLICWPTGFANWVCLGARLAGVRRLLVHCGNPPNRGARADWVTRYVMWPLRGLGAKCVCCSAYVRDQFQAVPGVSAGLFTAVWNCVRLTEVRERATAARAQRRAGEPFTVIMVATLERHKDHATLLRAVAAVRGQIPGMRVRLVGEGSLRATLEQLCRELEIADTVEFLGMRRDVPELLGQADIFVFSTTAQEGLGTVLVEALAAGLPVIASDVPACRELLGGGKFGRLAPPADATALSRGMLESASQTHVCSRLQREEYLEQFTSEQMLTSYLKISGVSTPLAASSK